MTTTPHGPVLLIANPRSGTGRSPALTEAVAAFREGGVEPGVELTTGPRHATELAERAVTQQGYRYVVAVGGDGTVHEVVNGLVDAESGEARGEDLVLGAIPGGSGCDFLKTWGLDVPVARLVTRHLLTDALLPLDVGRVRYVDPQGNQAVRLFANIAECGFGGDVTRLANKLPRFVGKARYTAATMLSLARLDESETTVAIDHTSTTEPVSQVIVANGQFFGSGIKVAPRALPDDGTFNVQTWRGGARDLVENLPKARSGEHLSHPNVREWQSSTVTVDGDAPLTLEADGEVLGTTPARFDVLERVLRLSA